MSLIIPWTDPGGPSCCCISCPDSSGLVAPTRTDISEAAFNALYSGGSLEITYQGNASTSVSVPCGNFSNGGSWTLVVRRDLVVPRENQCVDISGTGSNAFTEVEFTKSSSYGVTQCGIEGNVGIVQRSTTSSSYWLESPVGLDAFRVIFGLTLRVDVLASFLAPASHELGAHRLAAEVSIYNNGNAPADGLTTFSGVFSGSGQINVSSIDIDAEMSDGFAFKVPAKLRVQQVSVLTGVYTGTGGTATVNIKHIAAAP